MAIRACDKVQVLRLLMNVVPFTKLAPELILSLLVQPSSKPCDEKHVCVLSPVSMAELAEDVPDCVKCVWLNMVVRVQTPIFARQQTAIIEQFEMM